jgi:hypothetical protein
MENVGIFMAIWNRPSGIWPFGNFVIIWCIFPRFGTLYLEKSGNPAANNKAFVCGTF